MFHNEEHSPLYLLEKRAEVALQCPIFGPDLEYSRESNKFRVVYFVFCHNLL